MKKILFTLLVLFASCSFAALSEFHGTYRGGDLIIRNPFIDSSGHHCISSIYLNGKELNEELHHLTLDITLSNYISVGDAVHLRIYHTPTCKPTIMNIEVIKRKSLFAYTTFKVDQSKYHWSTRGEQKGSQFVMQRYLKGQWEDVKVYDAKGGTSGNNYNLASLHNSGINRYRLKYVQLDGFEEFSDVIDFRSNQAPVGFFPTKVKTKITFVGHNQRPVKYKVYDISGHKIMEGEGFSVDCTKLEPKRVYTLVFDNQDRKFQKK